MVELSLLNVGLAHGSITLITVLRAYQLHKQFFPTCVYLLKSSLSLLVLVTFGIYLMVLAANGFKSLLFGDLRSVEISHLHEYGWMTISESFLAMTIFRNEFDSKFAFVFAGLIICKGFHWILRDRVDYMEQAIRLPDQFHVKIITSIYLLAIVDFIGALAAISDVANKGPSMCILIANEFCLMMISLTSTFVRYLLNMNDIRQGGPWEHRSASLFYLDFAFDLAKLTVYTFYFATIVAFYGMPIHIIRDLYLTFRSFVVRVNDIIRYRQATADMEHKYPTVTAAELEAAQDKVCIICREEMEATTDGPKKLPCGHIFHLRCLRSWLERQQACPTCRKPVINTQPDAVNVANQFPGNLARLINQQQQQPIRVRINEAEPVMYVRPENIAPADDAQGQFVLRDTLNTDNPVHLEPVDIRMTPTLSNSSVISFRDHQSLTSSQESRDWRLESLDDQIKALEEVQGEIDSLMIKAKSLQEAIKSRSNPDINQDIDNTNS